MVFSWKKYDFFWIEIWDLLEMVMSGVVKGSGLKC